MKLTFRAAEMALKNPRQKIDWHSRRGTVCRNMLSLNHTVSIQWDDRKSADSWPMNAVELDEK